MTNKELLIATIQTGIENELYDKIKDLQAPWFFSIISTMVDHYIKDHSLNNREVWKELYEVSGAVFEECGDYGEEVI